MSLPLETALDFSNFLKISVKDDLIRFNCNYGDIINVCSVEDFDRYVSPMVSDIVRENSLKIFSFIMKSSERFSSKEIGWLYDLFIFHSLVKGNVDILKRTYPLKINNGKIRATLRALTFKLPTREKRDICKYLLNFSLVEVDRSYCVEILG
jgi:hypothetical protein